MRRTKQINWTPAQLYRTELAAIDGMCKDRHDGRVFVNLSAEGMVVFLNALEACELQLQSVDGTSFFAQLVKDAQMGFFADPIHGGTKTGRLGLPDAGKFH